MNEDTKRVKLMSVHSSKGLEFKSVFIVGLEENLFPSMMSLKAANAQAAIDEERRLFYVAITRSQKKLFLSYALTRYRFGRLKNCEPSRFLDDIDAKFIKVSTRFGGMESLPNPNYAKSFVSGIKKTVRSQPVVKSSYKPSADFVPSDTSGLKEGMKVEHPKFGFGVVTAMDESGANRKARINFSDFGEKTLLLSFAKLKIHEN